ncbi:MULTISPECIES: hypothetical protein [Cyanophyceae]|uniref:hypothetical protein n=1 Tax=Cyanophyceae TaxID=3028117 RepID=UPI0018EFC707|nr:hypothetical protein [Trichocoleus sp. FACHB-40]
MRNGYMGYGGKDQTGFHLAVLTNMELLAAIRNTEVVEALDRHLRERLETVNAPSLWQKL